MIERNNTKQITIKGNLLQDLEVVLKDWLAHI